MSSYIHMSLDDIIKKKREETRAKRSKVRKPEPFKSVPKMAPIMDARYKILSKNRTCITDARYKILSKNRTCITDAREKLTQLAKQKDARFKLDQLRQERRTVPGPVRNTFPNRGIFTRAPPATEIIFADSSRQVTSQSLATATSKIALKHQIRTHTINAARSIEKPRLYEFQHKPKPKPILQTAVGSDLQIIDDIHMEEEYVPQPLAMINRKPSMQVKIIAQTTGCANKCAANHRTIVAEKEKTPQIPPLLIPIPNKLPMATLRSDIIAQKTVKPPLEYRIIVSNLSHTVTGADIQELFEDVGLMLESRLVRPGIAEVIYQTKNDAQAAADLYHNRHLDGQPMNCLVVTPRAPSTRGRSSFSNKPELCRTHSNLELDLSTYLEC